MSIGVDQLTTMLVCDIPVFWSLLIIFSVGVVGLVVMDVVVIHFDDFGLDGLHVINLGVHFVYHDGVIGRLVWSCWMMWMLMVVVLLEVGRYWPLEIDGRDFYSSIVSPLMRMVKLGGGMWLKGGFFEFF